MRKPASTKSFWKTKVSTPGSGKVEFKQKNGAFEQAGVTREWLSDCPIFDGLVKTIN